VGHKFSLVLNREVTDEETTILRQGACAGAIFGTDSLLTDANVPVTRMDFDEIGSLTLVEAIEAALETVKKVPNLYVPGLTGPVYPPKAPEAEDDEAAEDEWSDIEAAQAGEPAAVTADDDAGTADQADVSIQGASRS
jgi:hypothetical protein